ncbi:6-hydroxymethylpterin diphosphokinase MptE-like protein [Sporosarcina sp. FSL K6-6792]|uniref:motility associated factor glycosyltransferase family protein n=1 Tax=Sporosarcina sp. FSL K6-6792 TaxID=2921559 RepID=UPI0030F72060
MKISIVETRTVPTVKIDLNGKSIVFHSKYDPLHEAAVWSESSLKGLKNQEEIVIVGLGAGYHIRAVAEAMPDKLITVIEFNDIFLTWFKDSPFYASIVILQNVSIKQFSDLSPTERGCVFSSVSSTNLLIHKNGLDISPYEYENVKAVLEDIKIQKNSISNQIGHMNMNFKKNIILNDDGIGKLKNKYAGKPMILVSAGPSLDKQLPLFKKIRDENFFIIGAVGTAVKPLVKFGIIPDFFAIIDPNQATYNQLTDLTLPYTTLYYLSTAYHDTIMLHNGPRRVIWQDGYEEAEKIASVKNDPIIQTGGSVATALLDLMVFLGGKSIALVGQDLAYTDGKSHANDTHAQKKINETRNAKKVINYDQTGEVYTAKNLIIYRKWFEVYAKEHQKLQLYNCTEGGAYIRNWEHISLQDYHLKYS